jgi:uncharacterized protein
MAAPAGPSPASQPTPSASPPSAVQRWVLDTNVVVAALLWNGVPRQLLTHTMGDTGIRLFTSPVLLTELAQTLGYAKLAPRMASYGVSSEQLVARYSALVSLVVPASTPRVVKLDADDDHVLAAAVVARAHLVVSGDRKHLLPIGTHQGIAIVTARQALERLGVAS